MAFITTECASGVAFTTPESASASLVNMRVVRFLQHRNVRVLVWSMCDWSDYNVRVNMECASRVFFIRVVRLYHVISFLRMSTYGSISADYSQLAL